LAAAIAVSVKRASSLESVYPALRKAKSVREDERDNKRLNSASQVKEILIKGD
jgi:hypothetical protein